MTDIEMNIRLEIVKAEIEILETDILRFPADNFRSATTVEAENIHYAVMQMDRLIETLKAECQIVQDSIIYGRE